MMKPHELPFDQQTCFVKGCARHGSQEIIALDKSDLNSSEEHLKGRYRFYLCAEHQAQYARTDLGKIPLKHHIYETFEQPQPA